MMSEKFIMELPPSLRNLPDTAGEGQCKFRKASLLDVPFIFYLIAEGSVAGSFPAIYTTPKGWTNLFGLLMQDILRPRRFVKNGIAEIKTLIFARGKEEIGFMQIGCMDGGHIHVIKFCAIAYKHRNQNHGSQMIRMYIGNLPLSTELIAYCTKTNRTMHRLLERLGFRKEKSIFDSISYHFTKTQLTGTTLTRTGNRGEARVARVA